MGTGDWGRTGGGGACQQVLLKPEANYLDWAAAEAVFVQSYLLQMMY